ncbi:endonuclease domain-containing protein [Brevundimonas vesicularis]
MDERGANASFSLDGGRAGDGGDTLSRDGGDTLSLKAARPAISRARRLRQDMTLPERMVWAELRRLKMNFRRQVPIGPYVVDFAHHDSRLIVELDVPVHDLPDVALRDLDRTAWLEGQGFRLLRFSNKTVTEALSDVIDQIRLAVVSPPSQPFPHQGGRALWRARDQWVRDEN